MCQSTVYFIDKASRQQQNISKVLEELEVIHGLLTVWGSVPLTPYCSNISCKDIIGL